MKKFGKFVAGLGIGTALGMLFAPKKGSELRKDVKLKFEELLEKAKDIDLGDIKEDVENKIADIKNELENFDKEKVLKDAQKKSKEIMGKAEDFVKLAKEKGTPIVQNLAKETKEKTIEVLEKTITKLKSQEKK